MSEFINHLFVNIANVAHVYLFPLMIGSFILGVIIKSVVHFMMKAQFNLVKEFEKRVHRHIDNEYPETVKMTDYDEALDHVWNKTIFEIYSLRSKNMRRKLDHVISFSERFFMVEEGAKRLARDIKKEAKYYKYEENPNFEGTSQFTLSINPYFQTLFDLVPLKFVNSLINILPGLFIIGGIFGTFLGITGGIPQLKNLDPSNIGMARNTLSFFLDNMAYSMNASVVGIFFSVCFTVINAAFSAKSIHAESVHTLVHSMELLWRDVKARKMNINDFINDKVRDEQLQTREDYSSPPPIPFKRVSNS